jgi:inhibitor of KinA sporulation pathway (predicted exonuclease)
MDLELTCGYSKSELETIPIEPIQIGIYGMNMKTLSSHMEFSSYIKIDKNRFGGYITEYCRELTGIKESDLSSIQTPDMKGITERINGLNISKLSTIYSWGNDAFFLSDFYAKCYPDLTNPFNIENCVNLSRVYRNLLGLSVKLSQRNALDYIAPGKYSEFMREMNEHDALDDSMILSKIFIEMQNRLKIDTNANK